MRFAADLGLPQIMNSACVRDIVSGEWMEPVGGDVGGGINGFSVSIEHHGSRSLLVTEVGNIICREGLA
jgi:hypothetical protein